MQKLEKILVVLDDRKEEQPALNRAAYLAKAVNASLHLYMCAYDPSISIATFLSGKQKKAFAQTIIEGTDVLVDKLAQRYINEGLTVTYEVAWERHPVDALIVQCEKEDYDLVMKHTAKRANAVFNQFDWSLMRYCPCPVLIVKDGQWDEVGQVLAAVDAAPESELDQQLNDAVLSTASFLAEQLAFELHIVTAYPAPPVFAPVSAIPKQQVDYRAKMKAMVESNIASMAEVRGLAVDHTHAEEGPVDWVVPNVSRDLVAEFVVLGNVSRQGRAGLSIGSVAEATLDALDTNVLMVRIGE